MSNCISIGASVPDFTAVGTRDEPIRLSDLRGHRVVLYFYPKDNTPGCTLEAKEFRDRQQAFDALGTVVFGVSRDSVRKHDNFRAKYGLSFDLLSDSDESLCNLFDVLRRKRLYGREYIGIERSTFVIDGEGILRREWRNVKPEGHAESVLACVKELTGN